MTDKTPNHLESYENYLKDLNSKLPKIKIEREITKAKVEIKRVVLEISKLKDPKSYKNRK